jgi:hypothetical protein
MGTMVMLDIAGKRMMQMKISFLTIHDVILVNNEKDCDTLKQVISDAFQGEFGIVPAMKEKT